MIQALTRIQTVARRWSDLLFGIDLRSLAALRIGLASIVLYDLYARSLFLRDHYTDWGILPRSTYLAEIMSKFHVSIHLWSGTSVGTALLFGLAAVFAFMMLMGYRTRLVTVVTWFLLLSLHARNIIILQAGDTFLRMLLFWCMFMPIGGRWSIDALRNPDPPKRGARIVSIATFAILVQVAMVYIFTGWLKTSPTWTTDFTALRYILMRDQFATGFGQWLSQFPVIVYPLVPLTLWLEKLGPIFMFIPVFNARLRLVLIAAFWSFHLGILVTMEVGLFSVISLCAWFPFFPALGWDELAKRTQGFQAKAGEWFRSFNPAFPWAIIALIGTVYAHVHSAPEWMFVPLAISSVVLFFGSTRIRGWVQSVPVAGVLAAEIDSHRRNAPKESSERGLPWGAWSGITIPRWNHAIALFFLLLVFSWNLKHHKILGYEKGTFGPPAAIKPIGNFFRIEQRWSMFAPGPNKIGGWFIVVGEQKDGKHIDLFFNNAKQVSWKKPTRVISGIYPTQRWRKFMTQIRKKKKKKYRKYYARYLCRKWNEGKKKSDPDRILWIEPIFMEQKVSKDFKLKKAKKKSLGRYKCR
jgi:hypothetical protein